MNVDKIFIEEGIVSANVTPLILPTLPPANAALIYGGADVCAPAVSC